MVQEIAFLIIGLLLGGALIWFIAKNKSHVTTSNENNNTLLVELSVEREKTSALNKTVTTKDEELKTKNEEILKNVTLLATKTAEYSDLKKSYDEQKNAIDSNQKKMEEHRAFIGNLEKYNSTMEAKLEANTNALNTLKEDHDKVRIELAQKNAENNELNKSNAEMSAKNKALNEKTQTLEEDVKNLKTELHKKTDEFNKANAKLAEFSANNSALNEKLVNHKEEIAQMQKTAHFQFEKIANTILEEKSGKFTEANKANIEAMLKPLGENIEKFKAKVEETYDKESKQRFSLEEKVKELIQQTNIVSAEANNLATALKGQAKKQGNWGEIILESILQKSGLVKDREYFIQKNIKDDNGKNLRPDVLVNLPDNRVIIIDSKVSLVAYDRFSSADTTDDQATYLTEHLKSIYGHINDLHSKKYDNLETALDFTMMFIPIEPAYLIAIQNDQELWSHAYSKRILLISPTNLIACLKLIADLWKREMQSKNAMEIVKRGELLYDKFVLFTESIEDIGKHINKTQFAYNSAVSQLNRGSGNLVSQAIKLKNLGLKSNKEIPSILQPNEIEVNITVENELTNTDKI